MTPKQWAEATALWEGGVTTLEGLAKKYARSETTFLRYFTKHGVKQGATVDAAKKRAAAAIARTTVNEVTILVARITETKEEHYKMAAAISRLTWNEILSAKKAGTPLASIQPALKSLDLAGSILARMRIERFAILGLDRPDAVDPDELPELIISELTAEEIKELRDRDISDLDDVAVGQIGLEGDPDDGIVNEGEE